MDTQLFSMGNSHCESEANIVELRERSHAIHLVNPYESVTVACLQHVLFRAVYIAWNVMMAAISANTTSALLVSLVLAQRGKTSIDN